MQKAIFFIFFVIGLCLGSQDRRILQAETFLKNQEGIKENPEDSSSNEGCELSLGCAECNQEDGKCTRCSHSFAKVNDDGECECAANLSLDAEGECVICRTPGCQICSHIHTGVHISDVFMNCSKCLDPNITPTNGRCLCSEDEVMVDGLCQECPVELTDGKCEPCDLPGCTLCPDGQHCTQCIDPFATIDQNGNCACLSYEQLNAEGTCSMCTSSCNLCAADSYQYSVCLSCVDQRSTLIDGYCICQDVEINSFGYCRYCNNVCNVEHCTCCVENDPDTCFECSFLERIQTNDEGGCECPDQMMSYDSLSVCSYCYATACKTCQTLYPFTKQLTECVQCIDSNARLLDGRCLCEEDKIMLDGICEDCPVQLTNGKCQPCSLLGCSLCPDGSTCEKCIDDWAYIQHGQCACYGGIRKINNEGYCSYCYLQGCLICDGTYDTQFCAQCSSEDAIINEKGQCVTCLGVQIDGQCIECSECNMVGCECCQQGQPDVCLKCKYQMISNSECACYGTANFDSEGLCVYCNIEGCKTCLHQESSPEYSTANICHECVDENAKIEHGRCVCDDDKVMVDGLCSECPVELTEGRCQTCSILGCDSCPDGVTCQQCTDTFYGRITGSSCLCSFTSHLVNELGYCSQSPAQGCLISTGGEFYAETCALCKGTALLQEGKCVCEGGVFNHKGYCIKCNDECKVFGCECCAQGNPNRCILCPDTTLTLTTTQTHLVLIAGQCVCIFYINFKINADKYCDYCFAKNCLSCTVGSYYDCEVCEVGTYRKTDHECASCEVLGCRTCSEVSVCDECIDDMATLVSGNHECRCPENMMMTNSGYCFHPSYGTSHSTSPGMFTRQSGVEAMCSVGCQQCSSVNSCTSCLNNFFINAGQCYPCHASCLSCKGQAEDDCVACPPGFYVSEGRCLQCTVNRCLKCSADGCETCLDTFVPVEGQCLSCGSNCIRCSSTDVCTECQFGFTPTEGKCQECLSSCARCSPTDISQCEACAVGQFLSSGECLDCGINCLECESSSTCLQCVVGFRVKDGECIRQCTYPCMECQLVDGEEQCLKCMEEESLVDNQCMPYTPSCNEKQICEVCSINTQLVGTRCRYCSYTDINCLQCVDAWECAVCRKGYFLEEGSCVECGPDCDECQSKSVCVTCKHRYFNMEVSGVQTGMCSFCQPPCLTCHGLATRCIDCVEGYSKKGWKCVSERKVIFKVTLDARISEFLLRTAELEGALTQLLASDVADESLTLHAVDAGSVKLEGSFQAESSEEGQTIYQDLKIGLKKGQFLIGYEIIGAEIEKENIEGEQEEEEEEEEKPRSNTGALVGGIVAACVALIIVVILLFAFRNRSGKSEEGDKDIQTKKEIIQGSGSGIQSQEHL